MIRAIIGIIALLLIIGGIIGGVYHWNKLKESEKAPTVSEGPEVALGDDALNLSDAEIPGEIVPEEDGVPVPDENTGEVLIPLGDTEPAELVEEEILPMPEEAEDTIDRSLREENPVPKHPVITDQSEGQSTVTAIEPVASTPLPTTTPMPTTPMPTTPMPPPTSTPQTATIEPVPVPTATPVSATTTPPVSTPTPVPMPTMEAGNYGVYTIAPVPASKLHAIDNAMKPLHVVLRKQQTVSQQRQAYRVSLGYYRTKSEAKAWARRYLAPKKIDNYVYAVQGMYSIQLGVYAEQTSIDRIYRLLHQEFPGWSLPLRTETTLLGTTSYRLSVRGITERLAKQVQNALFRLQVPSELVGI
ncbi:hypothetical protein CSA57_01950 [candidate division KSB3 bacterium]|nr:MAG: hypothetical protein CSA57_01950 [candidate division KSB3 bacterium]